MNKIEFSLGLDLAQESFAAALAPAGADCAAWRSLPHVELELAPDSAEGIEALQRWVRERLPAGARVAWTVVESTGALSKRALWRMNRAGMQASIINPRRSKALGESLGVRDKTDRIDGAILALYGAIHKPQPTILRSDAEQRLQELTRLRQTRIEWRTACENQLRELGGEEARHSTQETLDQLKKTIKDLDEQIAALIRDEPTLQAQTTALQQIKGVGPVTARTLTAELGDLRQYGRNQIAAVAGVFPKRFESGKTVWRRPRMAKGGGGRIRRVLYMGATSLLSLRRESSFTPLIERLRRRGLNEMCIIGALMRKILLVCRAVVCNGGHYDPQSVGRELKNA